MMDKLDTIFDKQKQLQQLMRADTTKQSYINHQALSLHTEISEFLQKTAWNWRKFDSREEAKKELVDAFAFFTNLCIAVNMLPRELLNRYLEKNAVNLQRAEEFLRKGGIGSNGDEQHGEAK